MIKNGDKVSGTYNGEPFNAIILEGTRFANGPIVFRTVGREGGDVTLKGTGLMVTPACFAGEFPKDGNAKFSKGDHVTTVYNGETYKCVVTKVGKLVHTVMWGDPSLGLKGPSHTFTAAHFELMPDPNPDPMADWEVRNYHEYPKMSRDCTAMSCDVFYKGVKVIRAMNHGQDSMNDYLHLADCPAIATCAHKTLTDLVTDLHPHMFIDAHDDWIRWYVSYRPFGVTLRKFAADMAKRSGAIFAANGAAIQ
jgi:hypothetical protein